MKLVPKMLNTEVHAQSQACCFFKFFVIGIAVSTPCTARTTKTYASKILTLALVTNRYNVTCNCRIIIKQTPSATEDLSTMCGLWLFAWRAVYYVYNMAKLKLKFIYKYIIYICIDCLWYMDTFIEV